MSATCQFCFPSQQPPHPSLTPPVLSTFPRTKFWQGKLQSIQVGKAKVNIEQLVIFDSGTTFTVLPSPVYNSLLNVVRRHATEREEGNDSSWFVGVWIIRKRGKILENKKRAQKHRHIIFFDSFLNFVFSVRKICTRQVPSLLSPPPDTL